MTLTDYKKRLSYQKNRLNDLSGKDWIKFTKSWFIHQPTPRSSKKMLHPAPFPESLIKEFIMFFTKKGQLVLDPFLGTGSSLVASIESARSCVGFEISRKYWRIAQKRIKETLRDKRFSRDPTLAEVFCNDSRILSTIWKKCGFPLADYCITSPPYWNQLKRNHIRQMNRARTGLDTIYSSDRRDVGNIDEYQEFLKALKTIFNEVYKVTKPHAYLTVITNNVFFDGRMYPLAFDTLSILAHSPYAWVPKDEKIWCQNDKKLLPLGVYNAYVGNRHHQYCLILRKED